MKKQHHPIIGLLIGGVVIVIAGIIQSHSGNPLNLPLPVWCAAFVPVGLGLITGGYLKNFKSPLFSAELESLHEVSQSTAPSIPERKPADWTSERAAEYTRVDGYMLAHIYRPSRTAGQKFDIFMFIVRHRKGSDGPPRRHLDDIAKAEFFFGDAWGNKVFAIENTGEVIGVRTHAWGTFLASCRISFRDPAREPVTLFRYVDFHMLQDAPTEV